MPRCLLLGAFPHSGQAGVRDKACATALATCCALGSTRNNLARRVLLWANKGGRGGCPARAHARHRQDDKQLRLSVQSQSADHSTAGPARPRRTRRDYQAVSSADAIWASGHGLQRVLGAASGPAPRFQAQLLEDEAVFPVTLSE